jgi:hypothetical protein
MRPAPDRKDNPDRSERGNVEEPRNRAVPFARRAGWLGILAARTTVLIPGNASIGVRFFAFAGSLTFAGSFAFAALVAPLIPRCAFGAFAARAFDRRLVLRRCDFGDDILARGITRFAARRAFAARATFTLSPPFAAPFGAGSTGRLFGGAVRAVKAE